MWRESRGGKEKIGAGGGYLESSAEDRGLGLRERRLSREVDGQHRGLGAPRGGREGDRRHCRESLARSASHRSMHAALGARRDAVLVAAPHGAPREEGASSEPARTCAWRATPQCTASPRHRSSNGDQVHCHHERPNRGPARDRARPRVLPRECCLLRPASTRARTQDASLKGLVPAAGTLSLLPCLVMPRAFQLREGSLSLSLALSFSLSLHLYLYIQLSIYI